jgi:D-amino-acid dehydrogenase
MVRTDAMVLGAGIVGTSIALHLVRRGLRVALVDRRAPGEETSYGNTGVIGSALYPASFPRELTRLMRVALKRAPEGNYHWGALPHLLPWLFAFRAASSPRRRAETARLMYPLMSRALAEHEELLVESAAMRYLRKTGLLTLYRSERSLSEVERELALAEELGVGAMLHDIDAARARAGFGARVP